MNYIETRVRQLFFCCDVDDQMDRHQISLASDPKMDESFAGPIRPPYDNSMLNAQKLTPTSITMESQLGNASAGSQVGSAPNTARSLSPEERQGEKERLQDMVKEFAKAVVEGQPCQWLDPSGVGGPRPATYSIDKALCRFTLQVESDRDIQQSRFCCIEMKDIQEVVKQRATTPFAGLNAKSAADLDSRFVCVQHRSAGVLQGGAAGELQQQGILLPNPYERERFYTCVKILRWAMDARKT